MKAATRAFLARETWVLTPVIAYSICALLAILIGWWALIPVAIFGCLESWFFLRMFGPDGKYRLVLHRLPEPSPDEAADGGDR